MSERIARKLSLERIPRKYRALAREAIEAEDARERAARDARLVATERAIEAHRRALQELASAKALRAMGEALREERAALRALRGTPAVAGGDLERAVRAGRKRLERAARALGVDTRRLRQIAATRARRIERASTPSGASGRILERGSRLAGTRLPLDPPEQVVTPPFPIGIAYRDSYASEGFTVGLDWEIDEPTGRIATRSWMRCPDADWWNDFAYVWVEADLVFVYTAPGTGRLSVIVDTTNLESSGLIRLEDEFGFSGSETHLRNFLTMRVFHPATPGLSSIEMNHLSHTGTDGTFAETARFPGSRSFAALESSGTVQAGDTFFVAIGTRNYDWCSTDDVEIETRSDWAWVIHELDFRTLPGGPIFSVGGRAAAASGRSRKRRAAKR